MVTSDVAIYGNIIETLLFAKENAENSLEYSAV